MKEPRIMEFLVPFLHRRCLASKEGFPWQQFSTLRSTDQIELRKKGRKLSISKAPGLWGGGLGKDGFPDLL